MNANQEKLGTIIKDLNKGFPERQSVITGMIASVLARKHALLIGPPGTAKSALVRAVAASFQATYFEYLLTKFTTPEEIFGPLSLKGLEQDRYIRMTKGRSSEVQILFLDEYFKANSAILNSVLTLANERVFHNDGMPVACPLVSLFGASNELPQGQELEAAYDRFLFRANVPYVVRQASFKKVLSSGDFDGVKTPMGSQELAEVHKEVDDVKVSDQTIDALVEIKDKLKDVNIIASDRRWKHSLSLVKSVAYLDGGDVTCPEDLLVIVDCLWREPKERAQIATVVGSYADPVVSKAEEIVAAAKEAVKKAKDPNLALDKDKMVAESARAMNACKAQVKMLEQLQAGSTGRKGARSMADSIAEVTAMRDDLAKIVSQHLGM